MTYRESECLEFLVQIFRENENGLIRFSENEIGNCLAIMSMEFLGIAIPSNEGK